MNNKKIISLLIIILVGISISVFTSNKKDKNLNTNIDSIKNEENLREELNNEVEIESVGNISSYNEAEIHFINTGNSDSILVKQGNKAALIDGGENGDENIVVPYLKSQGVTKLEYVFATHPDADHIGGLDGVINSLEVEQVFVSNGDAKTKTYEDFINAIANKGLTPSVPLLNSEFKLGSSSFKVISAANSEDSNNNSLVLLYTNGNDKILFTGDAGKEIESNIDVGDIDLLKVGHHGSKTSTSNSFINKIKPEYAVILVGKNNRYNHPNREVTDLLESNNIELHRTDECGNILFVSSGNGLTVDCKQGSYTSNDSTTSTDEIKDEIISKPTEIVYWTPNGKSYHSNNKCSTLSRSKKINYGKKSESGKVDPCDICY